MRRSSRGTHRQDEPGSGRPETAQIIPFRRSTKPAQKERPLEKGTLRDAEAEEDRLRMRQNLAAAVVLLGLLVVGSWVIVHLRESARIEMCVEAGHPDCSPLQPIPRT